MNEPEIEEGKVHGQARPPLQRKKRSLDAPLPLPQRRKPESAHINLEKYLTAAGKPAHSNYAKPALLGSPAKIETTAGSKSLITSPNKPLRDQERPTG